MTTLLLVPTALLAGILCFVFTAARRNRKTERRREERYETDRECTVSVLGEGDTRTACRVLNHSRSGMRIATTVKFSAKSQLMVEWETGFFVGTVRNEMTKEGEHVFGLRLVSSSSSKDSGIEKLW